PTVEVDLCGHATLASAHVLWETDPHADGSPARFETRSGTLTATRRGDGVELDFPADPVTVADPDPDLLDALGVAAADASRGGIVLVRVDGDRTALAGRAVTVTRGELVA